MNYIESIGRREAERVGDKGGAQRTGLHTAHTTGGPLLCPNAWIKTRIHTHTNTHTTVSLNVSAPSSEDRAQSTNQVKRCVLVQKNALKKTKQDSDSGRGVGE